MVSGHDLDTLLDYAEQSPWRLPDGSWVSIDVEIVDETAQRPHGLRYGMVLQDPDKQRVLGLDNSHGYDGAQDHEPFDHEHRLGQVHRRVPYAFTTASALLSHFFDRCQSYCDQKGMSFDLTPERGQ